MSRLLKEAARRGVRVPTAGTLRQYGLTQEQWCQLLSDQGWICPICKRSKVTFNTDHEHVPLWKRKPPAERATFVRGVLCAHCNWRIVHSNISAETAQRIADYFKKYEKRRNGCECLSG